jgi:hypothetical protein
MFAERTATLMFAERTATLADSQSLRRWVTELPRSHKLGLVGA